jgi:hypothetical protein
MNYDGRCHCFERLRNFAASSTVTLLNSYALSLANANDLILSAFSVDTSLTLGAGGTITQTGVLSGSGELTLNSGTLVLNLQNTSAKASCSGEARILERENSEAIDLHQSAA